MKKHSILSRKIIAALNIDESSILGTGSFSVVYKDADNEGYALKATVDESTTVVEGLALTCTDKQLIKLLPMTYVDSQHVITYKGVEYVIYVYRVKELQPVIRFGDFNYKVHRKLTAAKRIINCAHRWQSLKIPDLNKFMREAKLDCAASMYTAIDVVNSVYNTGYSVDGFTKGNIMIDPVDEQIYWTDPVFNLQLLKAVRAN